MLKKIITTGQETRKKLLAGAEKVGAMVSATLGPQGKNAIIYRKYKSPLITNDGVTIARHTFLDDEVADLGAQTIVEIALKTNEQAGDGTTTAVTIAVALIKKCFSLLSTGSTSIDKLDAMSMFRKINESKLKVIELLKKSAKQVKGDDVQKIISTSLENLEFGKIIGDMVEQVGKNGYISTEDNWATKYGIETEIVLGMKQYGSYVSPYMITNPYKKEAIAEEVSILVTNGQIEEIASIDKVLGELKAKGKLKIVIITESYSAPLIRVLSQIAVGFHQGKQMQILCIKAPALLTQQLEDIAVYTNAKFIDRKAGLKLSDIVSGDLGYAQKVVVTEDELIITGGQGKVKERIKVLEDQLKLEKDNMFKEKLKRRIASLASGIGIIRVGAMTETERGYLKLKIEDAVNAAKAAMEEGVVAGGGLALKEIAEELGKDNILYEALMSPYETIQKNAGGSLKIGKDIIDPVKVTRLAVENACSAAGILITTETAIAERKKTAWDVLEDAIIKKDDHDDFRDEENADLGAGQIIE